MIVLIWMASWCIVIHENQEPLIVAFADLLQQLPDEPSASGKIRTVVTCVRTSIITDTKNKINPHLVQLLDTLNSLLASRMQATSQKSRAESIQGIQGAQPESQIVQQINELIQEVNYLNRDTLSSELPKIPKRIQQFYLFRRAWFTEKIIRNVLRMKVVSSKARCSSRKRGSWRTSSSFSIDRSTFQRRSIAITLTISSSLRRIKKNRLRCLWNERSQASLPIASSKNSRIWKSDCDSTLPRCLLHPIGL